MVVVAIAAGAVGDDQRPERRGGEQRMLGDAERAEHRLVERTEQAGAQQVCPLVGIEGAEQRFGVEDAGRGALEVFGADRHPAEVAGEPARDRQARVVARGEDGADPARGLRHQPFDELRQQRNFFAEPVDRVENEHQLVVLEVAPQPAGERAPRVGRSARRARTSSRR